MLTAQCLGLLTKSIHPPSFTSVRVRPKVNNERSDEAVEIAGLIGPRFHHRISGQIQRIPICLRERRRGRCFGRIRTISPGIPNRRSRGTARNIDDECPTPIWYASIRWRRDEGSDYHTRLAYTGQTETRQQNCK
jgi:hypothetical protein